MSMAERAARNLIPPIFFKKDRITSRLSVILLRLVTGRPLTALQYEYLRREVEATPEIAVLFPEDRMREHWGYARLENTPESPNLYVHQIRYYRMYQYFRHNYPEMFDDSTSILNIGDTSGLLFRAMGRKGTSLNIRPERVAYIKSKGIEALVGNAEALDFADGSFDYVCCFQTLEHVRNPLLILSEMARVASKTVFVSIPNVRETRVWDRTEFIRDYRQADDVEALSITDDECHIFEFSSGDFRRILSYTCLDLVGNFPLEYFSFDGDATLVERLVARLTPSYFCFFVLDKRLDPKHAA